MGDILVKFMLEPVWPTAYHVKYLLCIVVPRYCDFLKLQFKLFTTVNLVVKLKYLRMTPTNQNDTPDTIKNR